MTYSTMNKAPSHLTGHGHKWCEHCQKTDHNDDECGSTRMVSPAEEMAWRLPSRSPATNGIFYRTTYAQFRLFGYRSV